MRFIAIGFALLILMGALLLMLPAASRDGVSLPFGKALFTATSATCVTGLIVVDTYTQFTFLGQLIILILIQIGGLGFMTVAVFFSMMLGRRIGLRERSLLMESVSTWHIGGIVRLTRRVLIGTACFEGVGAVILASRFIPRFGVADGIWYGIFHSVSAFCNAGFDLMGQLEPFSSLTAFSGDAVVSLTVPALILISGIGFIVWDDIFEKKWHFRKYRLHTKIMLAATAVLVIIPAISFYFTEYNAAFAGMSGGQRILSSVFAAVTPRTAGFNTSPLSSLSGAGTLLTTVLMFIGGGAGSTAGGIKVTTFAVFFLCFVAYSRRSGDISVFKRRLDDSVSRRVIGNTFAYMLLCLVGIFVLCCGGAPFRESIFECFSAVSTVGLSMGMTPTLPLLSHITLCILMFGGRVGTIGVAMALAEETNPSKLRYPVEKIIIG